MNDEQANQLVTQMMNLAVTANKTMLEDFIQQVTVPLAQRMEMIAQAQVNLGNMLRSNRRDFNALEILKVFLVDKLKGGGLSPEQAKDAVLSAYQIANEMENHAFVSDLQAPGYSLQRAEATRVEADTTNGAQS